MKKIYKVIVNLGEVDGDIDNSPDAFKEAVKESMQAAIELDEAGEDELDFTAEEIEEAF